MTISPSQKTGIEIPIRPSTITPVSTGEPRQTAATSPIPTLNRIQITEAPRMSESVTGIAAVICGHTFAPRFT